MQKVADTLAKRKTIILLHDPPDPNCIGFVRCNLDGDPVINVKPDLHDAKFLEVFLHEIAHAKLHNYNRKPISDRPINRKPITAAATAIEAKRERQADDLANHWLDWSAKNQASEYSELEARLIALTRYE